LFIACLSVFSTTGGSGGTTVVVTTLDDFTAAVAGDDKKIVIVSGTITGNTVVKTGSNKTILGRNAGEHDFRVLQIESS
jgi:pectate lyase